MLLLLQLLKGSVGLMFTNQSTEEVEAWFSQYCEKDFARAGFIASQSVELQEGQYWLPFRGMEY